MQGSSKKAWRRAKLWLCEEQLDPCRQAAGCGEGLGNEQDLIWTPVSSLWLVIHLLVDVC